MVVDEIALSPGDVLTPPVGGPGFETLLVMQGTAREVRDSLLARGLREIDRATAISSPLAAADVVAASSLSDVDTAIRPTPGVERGLVRPRGLVVVAGRGSGGLADALDRGVVVTTSRCGDFGAALGLLPEVPDLAAALVTTTLAADRLAEAFAAAAAPEQLKVVVTQDESKYT
jgi:hypothetical protein